MFRRTALNCVHLFNALVPLNVVQSPYIISSENLDIAKKALEESASFVGKAPFGSALDLLADVSDFRKQREVDKLLDECMDSYRAALYNPAVIDPFHRLKLHEAVMAAGFYQRSASPNVLKGESTRFVLHHYNFDVRRDTAITRLVHDTLLSTRQSTAESDRLLGDLLQLERRLFGRVRFAPTAGRQWFVLGLPFEDVKTEEEILRVLDIAVVKEFGNFEITRDGSEKLWETITVFPKEETSKGFIEEGQFATQHSEKDLRLQRRVEKPRPPLTFWERVREKLLRYWVMWFSLWIMFFMVDEEIITIITLIFLKRRQMRIIEDEAEKSGGKVYIASSSGRSRESP